MLPARKMKKATSWLIGEQRAARVVRLVLLVLILLAADAGLISDAACRRVVSDLAVDRVSGISGS